MGVEKDLKAFDEKSGLDASNLLIFLPLLIIVSALSMLLPGRAGSYYSDLLTIGVPPIALVLAILIYRHHTGEFRFVGLGLALTLSLWWVAEVLWVYYEKVLGVDPYPSPADFFWLTGYVPIVMVTAYSTRPYLKSIRLGEIAAAIFSFALVVYLVYPIWFAGVLSSGLTPVEATAGLAYVFADLLFLALAILLLLFYYRRDVSYFWLILAMSFTASVLGDTLFITYEAADKYYVGSLPDVFLQLKYLIIALGLYQVQYKRIRFFTFEDRERELLLEHAGELAKAHAELQVAYNELKNLDRMKDEFLSNVSHELKTPLTTVKGVIDILKGGAEMSNEEKELLDLGKHNLNRLNRLLDDILYLSKIYGKEDLKKGDVHLGEIIAQSIEEATPFARESGVTIERDAQDNLWVLADGYAMHKLFSILLNNAIKFNTEGGMVKVSARRAGESIRAEVSDTGIGITKEQLGKLFTKFYQVDGSTTRKYPGTGIGLSIAKSIVERHGGKIWVESEAGSGSTFIFELPSKGYNASLPNRSMQDIA